MSITFRQLDSFEVMIEETMTLLKKHMQSEDNMPYAIMLPDGRLGSCSGSRKMRNNSKHGGKT